MGCLERFYRSDSVLPFCPVQLIGNPMIPPSCSRRLLMRGAWPDITRNVMQCMVRSWAKEVKYNRGFISTYGL
ncbi:Protein of unknown function [Pyronema omphalodes CBS 100304]|uniref:Uncharacterized protein n=1 Tax=Pyronema omphalodes (strain CBS 100304) TaxID=1076935 RepID=U4L4B6_PYROM|nr:Protein of unknown function [Pyronema omphalodes CBS 100304]